MFYPVLLALATCQFLSLVPLLTANLIGSNEREICPFMDTVNLTDVRKLENGSYVYYKILIPPEKQQLYNYDIQFNQKVPVPEHLRGCVCNEKPCMKLCCRHYEYLRESTNESLASSCEIITPDMPVSWYLDIQLKNSEKIKNVNIFEHFTIQVGLPCDEPEALDDELGDEWILSEDGTLILPSIGVEDRMNYCYSPVINDENEYTLKPHLCATVNVASAKVLLKSYAMAISSVFLILTIVVYLVLKELRGNLRGKLLICYLSSLTIGYIIVSIINTTENVFQPTTCSIMGFTGYYFTMAAFLWLSVLCYDIWKNFKDTNIEFNPKKHQQQFMRYSLYAWITASLATGLLVFLQLSPSVSQNYKPGINGDLCWLDVKKWCTAIYFFGPNLIILLFNIITFVHLTRKIYKVRNDLAKVTHKDKFFKENTVVILRLFLVMGISWIFDILSYCLKDYPSFDFIFIITDLINGIQGLLIFILFVLKPKILNRLINLFKKEQPHSMRKSVSTSSTRFTKLQTGSSVPTANTP